MTDMVVVVLPEQPVNMLGEVPASSAVFTPTEQLGGRESAPPLSPFGRIELATEATVVGGDRTKSGGGTGTSTELAQIGEKIEKIKKWTLNTFKNSKQQVFEQLGKIDRTVDPEFDNECESLRELHRRYGVVVATAQAFLLVFEQLGAAEKNLAESLYQLSLKEQAVKTQCSLAGDSLRKLSEHAIGLEACMRYFLSAMQTMHEKTITDTLTTINTTEQARIEFDVARHELAGLQSTATASPSAIVQAKEKTDAFRDRYEQLKRDVRVKFRLLEENRVKVLSVQLDKIHSALCAYFSGNAQALAVSVEELRALVPPDAVSFLQ